MRIKLTFSYDGADFAGWQVQPGQRTVQGEVEAALSTLYGEPIRIHAGGRTDAGVHALHQVAIYDADRTRDLEAIQRALNAMTSDDVAIIAVNDVPDDFDPRRWAREKRYRYRWQVAPVADPLRRREVRWLRGPFDVLAAQAAAQLLVGTHDFSAFRATGCGSAHARRTVGSLQVTQQADEVVLHADGNGFLRHMVRIIAGTVEQVGLGRRDPSWVARVLLEGDRSAAGPTLPAKGLCLISTRYGAGPPAWAH